MTCTACSRPAVPGETVCRFHGGIGRQAARRASERATAATQHRHLFAIHRHPGKGVHDREERLHAHWWFRHSHPPEEGA